jgi:MFS family permease
MGWFQSSANISNNIMQIFWGKLADTLKQRIPFIVAGSLILSLLWIPMILVTNATQLIIILAIQALLGSMATPAWTALIGDRVPGHRLGRANASISLYASIGALIATLASGTYMITTGGTFQHMLFIPFIFAAASGTASSLIMLRIKEAKTTQRLNLKQNLTTEIIRMITHAGKTQPFMKYCTVAATFEFFMSIAWPLFSLTQIRILGASVLQLAILSFVQSFTLILFQNWAGRRADIAGRRQLLILFRFALVTVPLAYAFIPNINILIIIGAFWGIAQAFGQASATAYLLDVTPQEHRASFTAVYNLIIGTVTFTGSLIGGYISNYTTALFGLGIGLQIVYTLSAIGRTIGATFHLALKETLKKQQA